MTRPIPTQSRAKDIEARLTRVQAIAGGLFLIFLVLHLSNTVLAGLGPETYNSFQRTVRVIYQQPLLELLLVVFPLLSHAIAGVWLYVIRKKRRAKRGLKYQLQTWAGFFLLFTVFGHALATRGISFWYGPFPEFAGVSVFAMVGTGLFLSVLLLAVVSTSPSNQVPSGLLVAGAVVVTVSLLAFGGKLFTIDDPRDNDYARQYAEFFDIDLSPGATALSHDQKN